jgi:proteic killer suppression protein
MIRSFRSKPLAELWGSGRSSKINPALQKRIRTKLDRLDVARNISELNIPGFDFHALKGFDPVRYTIHVNGPWCVTFEFHDGDAHRVDLEQYH